MNLKEYARLQDEVRKTKEAAAKAVGAYEQELLRLKTDYGVDEAGAEEMLKAMQPELDAANDAAYRARADYITKWGAVL